MAAIRCEAKAQVDGTAFTVEHFVEQPPEEWLAKNLKAGGNFGYDPLRTTIGGVERLAKACERANAKLVAVETNPVDAIWKDRPEAPLSPVVLHDIRFAGESAQDKIKRLQGELGLGEARCRGFLRSRFRRVDVQHSRQRCRAHAAAAFLGDRAAGGKAVALHRCAQALE